MSGAHRKGRCPGALKPMESGDGLIVRLRITGGEITSALGIGLAQCAEAFGNGQIDLTSRANLQLRGVTERTLAPLQAQLDELGLLDDDAAAESVRNILVSPLAGLDPQALTDIRPLAQTLDKRLRKDRALHALPGKFLFLIDDGGRLPLPIGKSDIALVAGQSDDGAFRIYLGGIHAGVSPLDGVCDTAARLALAFLELRENETRMADLVRRMGTEPIAQCAGVGNFIKPSPAPATPAARILGVHALGSRRALGLGMAFGRIDAAQLRRLAGAAAECSGVLRLSPWRAMFLVAEHIAAELVTRLRDAGFVLDDDAPIRSVAACSGRPACLHGEADSRADAARLAQLAQNLAMQGIALHVSACEKGCAHPVKAPVTLVGREGRYDLVLDGRPSDAPILRGIELSEIGTLLRKLAQIVPEDREAFLRQPFCEAER